MRPLRRALRQGLGAAEPCTVAPSVLMACERVRRGGYRLDATLIAASFRDLPELQPVDALDPMLADQVLRANEAGLDFADAPHAVQRRDGERFATCDRQLARRAPRAGVRAVERLAC